MKYVKLSQTSDLMPTLGLGTWQASPEVIELTVYKALELGYKHIDTAFNYNNEEAIGNAIKKWINDGKGTRKELFITTKLPHVGNRASDVKKFLSLQLKRLQMDYVDLYLIHVPFGFRCDHDTLTPVVKSNGEYDLDLDTDHIRTWKVMEECQRQGLIRNLGLSNFNESQIAKIINASTFKPQVLQVELHAYFQQLDLRTFCAKHDIVVTAYAPLGSPGAKDHFVNKYNYSPDAFPDLLGHPEVNEIAKGHEKTPAQILLRYLVQQKVVVIPKSTSEKRLKVIIEVILNGLADFFSITNSHVKNLLLMSISYILGCFYYRLTASNECTLSKGTDYTMRENSNIYDFELTPDEINKLKKLDKGEDGRIFNFLFWKGVENHPEYPFKFASLASNKE